jgi:hypothetical protein
MKINRSEILHLVETNCRGVSTELNVGDTQEIEFDMVNWWLHINMCSGNLLLE